MAFFKSLFRNFPETLTLNLNVKVSGEIDHFHHGDGEVLAAVNKLGEKLMSVADDLKALQVALNNATTAEATRLKAIFDLLSGGAISQADQDVIKAGIQASIDRLNAIGADPANPFPA